MQLALILLGGLLAALVLILLLALATPVDVRLRLSRYESLQVSVEARAFGGWAPWIKIAPHRSERATKASKPRKEKKKRSLSIKRPWSEILAAAKQLVIEVFGAISVHEFSVEGEFGTNDPADTGTLYGMLAPFNFGPCRQINLWPNFEGPCLQGQCTAVLRFTPFALAIPFARFGWVLWRPAK